MSLAIAYLGLGYMGAAMSKRLLAAGHSLTVWNRDLSKCDPLVALGATAAKTAREAVAAADVVFTMVADDRAINDITLGETGFLSAMKPGSVHVSMSTILPTTARSLAQEHRQAGVAYLAAPVFGRPVAAEAGQLWICCAGEDSGKAQARPLLETLGQKVTDFGADPGAANIVKLAGNFMIGAAIESMSEAFAFGEKNGIDPETLIGFFSNSIFACPIYKNYGGIIARQEFEPAGFRLALGRKDIGLVAATAHASNVPMPLLGILSDRFSARTAKGGSDMDWSSIAIDVATDAGLR